MDFDKLILLVPLYVNMHAENLWKISLLYFCYKFCMTILYSFCDNLLYILLQSASRSCMHVKTTLLNVTTELTKIPHHSGVSFENIRLIAKLI